MKIGYARISTDEQSDNAQIDALEAAGLDESIVKNIVVDQNHAQN